MTDMETILHLTASLRQMDQLVYRMGQCTSWEAMRPIFQELLHMTNSRMQEESDRIRMLLVPEIVRTYAKPSPTHPSSDGHPQLEGPTDASSVAPVRQLDGPSGDGGGATGEGASDDEGTLQG